ncbi:MAG TPA: tetratricopeptide repeat protein [Methylophilaceae bacterium]|nr:tetratricopeptide repeat protein [Methylophilaceae bacterium]
MAKTAPDKPATQPTATSGPSLEEMNAIVALFQAADWTGLETSSRAMTEQWPLHGFGWKSLGVALKMQKRDEQALQVMRKAAALMPNDPDVHNNLASALREAGDHTQAIAHFEQALVLNPDFPDALNGLAITLKQSGDPQRVIALLKRAIALRPTFTEAHYNLGNAIKAAGDLDEAVKSYMEALKLRPGYADAYNSLGNTLMQKGEPEEALACYQQSLTADPSFHEAYNGRGNALRALGRLDDAISSYQEALRLQPRHEGFHHNLAIAYSEKMQVDAALACYRESLRIAPDYASSRAGLGMLLIANGQMEEGWPLYESRWEGFQQAMEGLLKRPETALPQWRGEPVGAADALLLFCEQGLGDSLQFIRYVPLLARIFAQVTVVCPGAVLNIFRGSFQLPNVEFIESHPEDQSRWHWHSTTMSVPLAMHTTLDNIPADVPYLVAPVNRVQHWAAALEKRDHGQKPRVGLVWAGGNLLRDDKKRSIPPEQFLPLTAHRELTWVSLQKANDDRKKARSHHADRLIDWMDDIRDFADTAALIQNLDLVISVDTAVAHLAGALGKPVWMLNRYAGDFRWMFHREDSPWYPGMRLFRQPAPGDWASVLAKVQLALEAWRPGGHETSKAVAKPTMQDDMQRLFDQFTQGMPAYNAIRDRLFADYRQARGIDLSQHYVELLVQFGYGFFKNQNLPQACKFWREVLALRPDHHYALHHLGVALAAMGRHAEACALFRRAIAVEPERHYAHYCLAASLLALGQWEEGWRYYEYRWYGSDQAMRHRTKGAKSLPDSLDTTLKRWRGESPAAGEALLLYAEQGYGDQIQFVRLLPQVATRFARVDFCCSPAVHALFANYLHGIGDVRLIDEIPQDRSAWQSHCPLLSLPLALGLQPDGIPPTPYLAPPADRLAVWTQRLQPYRDHRPRIGFAWSGSAGLGADQQRSIDPLLLIGLLTDTRYRWFSLQKADTTTHGVMPESLQPLVIDFMPEIRDFADTAALIAQLDLVVTVDTAVAHLAGAMGKPVWLLNRYAGDWRWVGHEDGSPWYGSMRIFHQRTSGQWQEVIARVAQALDALYPASPDTATDASGYGTTVISAGPPGVPPTSPAEGIAQHLVTLFCSGQADALVQAAAAVRPTARDAGLARMMSQVACLLSEQNATPGDALPALQDIRDDAWPADLARAVSAIHTAAGHFQQCLSARQDRALALHKLAAILLTSGLYAAAATYYRQSLSLRPDFIVARTNLGTAHMRLGQLETALDDYQRALELDPGYVPALNGMAVTCKHLGRFEKAIATFRSALAIQPGNAELLNNLGATLLDMHRVTEAIDLFRRAIAADPAYHAAYMGLALALLFNGEWPEGWRYYEHRWQGSNFALQGMVHKTDTNLPQWRGEPVKADARLLVFCEQGLGDNLQFVRYLPLAAARFAQVTLFCPAALYNILAGSFCAYTNIEVRKVLPNDHSAWDFHCYIMSMPLAFGTTIDNIPDQLPYLRSPANRVQHWAERLQASGASGLRVGLVWAGGSRLRDDRQRSIPLTKFAGLLHVKGVSWVSLQKEWRAEDTDGTAEPASLIDWMPEIFDFADTAALIDNLDLVISVDTAVAHLAGALGRPVWLLNRYAGDWRWMYEREDSPWYPGMRIFNQTAHDDWDDVLQRVEARLQELASSAVMTRSLGPV